MKDQIKYHRPSLDAEMAAYVKNIYYQVRNNTREINDNEIYNGVYEDISDMIKAFEAYADSNDRYTFLIKNDLVSVVHFITFTLLAVNYSYTTSVAYKYDDLKDGVRQHFLAITKKRFEYDEEAFVTGFDSTFNETLLAIYCYVASLYIGEVPY